MLSGPGREVDLLLAGSSKGDRSAVEAPPAEDIRIESEYWTQVTMSPSEVLESGTIWVHGPMHLRVTLEDEGGMDIPTDDAKLYLVILQPSGEGLDEVAPPSPWSDSWYRRHGLRRMRCLELDSGGSVVELVPRLRYLGLRAVARGLYSALVELNVPSATEPSIPELEVRIRLHPGLTVTGSVMDEKGKPVSGARVQVSVFRDVLTSEADISRLLIPGFGLTIAGQAGGTCSVNVAGTGVTDEAGAYSIDVPQSGRAVLQVLKQGCLPFSTQFALDALTPTHSVTLRSDKTVPTVQLLWEGVPLPGQDLMAGDITDLREQTCLTVPVDARGRIREGWLQPGRHYGLVFALPATAGGGNAMRRERRFLAWEDGGKIELSKGLTDLDTFKASVH